MLLSACSFGSAVTIPARVDAARAKAFYQNGVLKVTMRKREQIRSKRIKLQVE